MENANTEIMHYGVMGMKWGVRRYQNEDGTLTALGKKKGREYEYVSRASQRRQKKADKTLKKANRIISTNNKKIERAEKKGLDTKEMKAEAKVSEKYYTQKAADLQKRADASKKFDKKQVDYAKRTSMGKAFVGNFLWDAPKYRTYAMSRSAGKSRGESFVRSIVDINMGVTGWSLQQHFLREDYIDAHVSKKK